MKVYIANVSQLNDPSLFDSLYESVNEERQKKVDSYKFQKDKNLSLGAGVLLNYALSARGINNPQFFTGDFGKPFIADKNICFNLSHSGELAVCAIAKNTVGCDVEKMDSPPFEVARKVFSHDEQELLSSASEEERVALFYRLWTAKESFLKMVGCGLGASPKDFSISLENNHQLIHGHQCSFFDYLCDNKYLLTICIDGYFDNSDVSFEKVDLRGF